MNLNLLCLALGVLILTDKAERVRNETDTGIGLTCMSSGMAKQKPPLFDWLEIPYVTPTGSGPFMLCLQEN